MISNGHAYGRTRGDLVTITKGYLLAAIVGAIIAALACIEIAASFFVPSWPARALRSTPPPVGPSANSWGMYDLERQIIKPSDVRFRAIFVGDSFIQGSPDQPSPTMAVERLAAENGLKGLEAVSLGVPGTDPRSYYYRTRDVALSFSPDALLVFFFSGNDFLQPGEGYGDRWIPPLVDESPGAAVLGNVMPRTNWLLINRLRMSEVLRSNKPVPDENQTLSSIVHGPPEQRVPRLVQHMKRYYYPEIDEGRLTEILARGGEKFWQPFETRETLQGWLVNLMVSTELDNIPINGVRTSDDAAKLITEQEIQATLSWLVALNRVATSHNVPLHVYVIPPANVSPDFVEFWKPWPHFFSWHVLSDVRHQKLVDALRHSSVPFVDLRPDLLDVRGAYRLTDGHWSAAGVQIVAKRIYAELSNMAPH
jgi:hypothetical protein